VLKLNVRRREAAKGEPKPASWPTVIAFVGRDPICESPETIASQITAACRRCGLTRAKLAKHIGASVNKFRSWEIGQSKMPDQARSILLRLIDGEPSALTVTVAG
jgi:ribosome-binding protein aMBF1 (putative translation factor)